MASAAGRRPKRKLPDVSYFEEHEDDDVELGDEYIPDKKAKKTTHSKLKANKRTKLNTANQSTNFSDLPGEIRNRIYELALLPPHGTHILLKTREKNSNLLAVRDSLRDDRTNNPCSGRVQRRAKAANRYAMLTASRATNHEAISILYAQPLHFKHQPTLVHFLADIGHENRSLLRDVTLMTWNGGRHGRVVNKAAFSMLADSAKTLRRLRIDGCVGHFYGPSDYSQDHVALVTAERIFHDAFPLLEAIGRVKGAKDAALDVIELGHEAYVQWRGDGWMLYLQPAPSDEERQAMEKRFMEELSRLLRRGR